MKTNINELRYTEDGNFSIAVIKNGLFWNFAFLWVMLIALGWTGEEPSKMRTIIVVFAVFILAILIIRYAKNKGIISSKKLWITTFLIKITLTAIILRYFWLAAFPDGTQRATGAVFDQRVFDYCGKLLAESNFDVSLIRQVYNYVGQIYYIGAIYWLFGISTFYVGLFNIIFSLVTFLALTAFLIKISGNSKYWQLMCLGMFFPELLYFDSLPGKEVIVNCMISLSFLFVYKFLISKKTKYLLFLLLSLGILISVRAVMSIIIIAIGAIWIIVKYRNKLKLIFLYGVITLFIFLFLYPLIIKYTGGAVVIESTILNLSKRAEYGIAVTQEAEKSLSVVFTTDNPMKAIIFAPIRALFLFVAPFPRLGIDWSETSWFVNCSKVSLWIILLCFPIIMAATFQKSCRKSPLWFYMVFTYWILLLFISNGALFLHERYRVMSDPFLIGVLLIGIKYGNMKKFIFPSFILILTGYATYYILKQFV